jgi:hypothetical protein
MTHLLWVFGQVLPPMEMPIESKLANNDVLTTEPCLGLKALGQFGLRRLCTGC